MNIIVLHSCLSVFSHCRYTLRLLLSLCDLVKLHVAFFFSVLPFMVNKDEYWGGRRYVYCNHAMCVTYACVRNRGRFPLTSGHFACCFVGSRTFRVRRRVVRARTRCSASVPMSRRFLRTYPGWSRSLRSRTIWSSGGDTATNATTTTRQSTLTSWSLQGGPEIPSNLQDVSPYSLTHVQWLK